MKHLFTKHLGKTCLVLALVAVVIIVALANTKAAETPKTPEVAVTNTAPEVPKPVAFVFNNDLKLGMTNPDVLELQKYLNANGFTIALTGLGSVGNESPYFGEKTKEALIKFQIANNLTPALGYFGSKTRAVINQKNSPECGTGDLFNRMTGVACPSNPDQTPSFPAGCTSASGISTTTGYSCATGLPVPPPAPVVRSGIMVARSSAKDILSMTFAYASDPGTTITCTLAIISVSETEGYLEAPSRGDCAVINWHNLVIPTMTISPHATVSPRSGVAQDFSMYNGDHGMFPFTVTFGKI